MSRISSESTFNVSVLEMKKQREIERYQSQFVWLWSFVFCYVLFVVCIMIDEVTMFLKANRHSRQRKERVKIILVMEQFQFVIQQIFLSQFSGVRRHSLIRWVSQSLEQLGPEKRVNKT